jgi:2-polyprenyl-3-methyl-5-hydroxy-6-metoxy-1,4-benzoquinol methylase
LAKNFNYYGADFSQTSIDVLKETLKNEKHFKDAFHITGFPINHDRKYDFIICCEVIEHLDDKTLDDVTFELGKLLKPDGVLYITTPNDENLDSAKTMCPECGCVFHRWQHMRSWNEKTVSAYFSLKGFKTISTKTLDFDNNPLKGQLRTIVKTHFFNRTPRNLVYLGKKG